MYSYGNSLEPKKNRESIIRVNLFHPKCLIKEDLSESRGESMHQAMVIHFNSQKEMEREF